MRHVDVLIVGGGIAGLATAWHLAGRGAGVRLVEREPLFAAHASGRNAAIFRQLEHDAPGVRLARRSDALLPELQGEGPVLLARTGALYLGTERELGPLALLAGAEGVQGERLDRAGLEALVPALRGTDAAAGLHVPGDGVLDVHAIAQALAAGARARGASLTCGTGVEQLCVSGGRVTGVRLADGSVIEAGMVVLAVGAWSASLGASAGLPIPIEPRRRHLALLGPAPDVTALGPVVWRLDEGIYVRREAGGLLASPCDEQAWPPGVPTTSPAALEQLAVRLARLAPSLAASEVRTAWACLRSFTPDGTLVAGRDPRARGLTWIAGLGGRGMSVGLGLGEVAAAAALDEPHALIEALSPARWLRG